MPQVSKLRFKSRFPIFFFFFLILLSGTVLGLSTHGFIIDFKQLGFSFISTFLRGTHGIYSAVSGLVTDIQQNTVLRQEKALLEEQLADYMYLERTNVVLRQENDRLKTQIGYMQSLNYVYHPAVVIARDMDVLYTSFTINKGSADGIKKNMPVLAVQDGQEGLVGKIIEVSKHSSKIMPVYDYRCNISVRVFATGDIGLLSGMGSFDIPLSLKYVQNTIVNEIKTGDLIITSGENENYLRNVPVGKIAKISMLDYDSSLSIDVLPVVNFSRLESVFAVDVRETESREAEAARNNVFFYDPVEQYLSSSEPPAAASPNAPVNTPPQSNTLRSGATQSNAQTQSGVQPNTAQTGATRISAPAQQSETPPLTQIVTQAESRAQGEDAP